MRKPLNHLEGLPVPYLQFDVDAFNVAPHVARASGIPEDTAIAGLARMWLWCWREKTDTVTATGVRGFFGADIAGPLATFGFLEPSEKGFRVRGATRRLRVGQAQSEAGKKARGNLKRGKISPRVEPEESRETPGGVLRLDPEVSPGSTPIHPNTNMSLNEMGALNTSVRTVPVASDPPPPKTAEAMSVLAVYACYRKTFERRHPEPSAVERDIILARLREGFDVEELCKAVRGLANSVWHRKKGFTGLSYALNSRDTVERCLQWADAPPDATEAPPRYDPNQGIIRGVEPDPETEWP